MLGLSEMSYGGNEARKMTSCEGLLNVMSHHIRSSANINYLISY